MFRLDAMIRVIALFACACGLVEVSGSHRYSAPPAAARTLSRVLPACSDVPYMPTEEISALVEKLRPEILKNYPTKITYMQPILAREKLPRHTVHVKVKVYGEGLEKYVHLKIISKWVATPTGRIHVDYLKGVRLDVDENTPLEDEGYTEIPNEYDRRERQRVSCPARHKNLGRLESVADSESSKNLELWARFKCLYSKAYEPEEDARRYKLFLQHLKESGNDGSMPGVLADATQEELDHLFNGVIIDD